MFAVEGGKKVARQQKEIWESIHKIHQLALLEHGLWQKSFLCSRLARESHSVEFILVVIDDY